MVAPTDGAVLRLDSSAGTHPPHIVFPVSPAYSSHFQHQVDNRGYEEAHFPHLHGIVPSAGLSGFDYVACRKMKRILRNCFCFQSSFTNYVRSKFKVYFRSVLVETNICSPVELLIA